MRNRLFLNMVPVVAAAVAALAGQAMAQSSGNHAPVCEAKTMTITEPGTAAAVIAFNPIMVGPACSDADGDILTLTSVSAPATLVVDKQGKSRNQLRVNNTMAMNSSVTITFNVSDGKGGTTQSTVTLIRTDAAN